MLFLEMVNELEKSFEIAFSDLDMECYHKSAVPNCKEMR